MNDSIKPTALITGASRGLGLALAEALANRGWNLIINARGGEALEVARHALSQHVDVDSIAGDIVSPETRQSLAEASRRAGGIDALINNASILGPSPMPRLCTFPIDRLEAVFDANVFAPLALIQQVGDLLKPGGCIVNVTSDAGVEAYEGWGGYGASKAALEQISAVLAQEEAGRRIYWVDPGDMRTAMHQEAFPGVDIADRPLPEASVPGFLALIEGNHPSGRYVARSVGAEAAQ